MSPNKQTRATRGPCHRLSMLKRHRWPFRHRAAKSELPVHTDDFWIPVPFHSLHNGREENNHTETFPKKIRPPPLQPRFCYFEDPYEKTPLLYIYIPSAPKKPTSFVKYPGFPLSPPPASHQTQLSPGFLQSLCLSQWLNLEPVDLIKQNG